LARLTNGTTDESYVFEEEIPQIASEFEEFVGYVVNTLGISADRNGGNGKVNLEGALLLIIMAVAFFRTDARYYPGRLLGIGMLVYGAARTLVETVREPDPGLGNVIVGLTMGQVLSIPMIALGIWLIATSKARRTRVEGIGGSASIA
ncbi:MAG: prolipoprotein diacylglyceryl transferase family protein, partial [Sphingomonadaceae bacterium]